MNPIASDGFLDLLAEALRAGPVSPEWRSAVEILRQAGADGEEYRILLDARHRLEQGRDYRAVRPGPGFSKRILDNLDRDDDPPAGDTARTIALIAAAAILIAVVAVVWSVIPRAAAPRPGPDELNNTVFVQTALDADFSTAIPDGWRAVGGLALSADAGLRPAPVAGADPIAGGAIVAPSAFPADLPLAIDMACAVEPSPGAAMALFVTTGETFTADRAMTDREFAVTIQDGVLRVVDPDGHVQHQSALPSPSAAITLRLNETAALVALDGRILWRGPLGLDPDRHRRVGIRFLIPAGDGRSSRVRSLRIMTPAR